MILIAFGTRPELLKIKPLIDVLKEQKIDHQTIFTGQHSMLNDGSANFNIVINHTPGVDRLNNIISNSVEGLSKILHEYTYADYIMVQGDTTSALSIALAAFNWEIKIIHLEAGLRTYDLKNPFPEEGNRRMISQIADIHLCPTENNKTNLIAEKVGGKIYVVGNTGLDNLVKYKDSCEEENKVLVTLHRRENHKEIKWWFKEINDLARQRDDLEFILPIHPNPDVMKHKDILTHVKVIDPLPHDKLLAILVKTCMVITDSGGIQEEASFFNKKTIVCRKTTERPEALNLTSYFCSDPMLLHSVFNALINLSLPKLENDICPFGDGRSSERIVQILKSL